MTSSANAVSPSFLKIQPLSTRAQRSISSTLPGHADFGGEVERVLKMVNGVILVVDAFEGAMPQTQFRSAQGPGTAASRYRLHQQDATVPKRVPLEVQDEVLELFLELDATDEQLDCPFVYASAKNGSAIDEPDR